MRRGWRRFWLWTFIGVAAIWMLVLLFAHPFFAVTNPSGGTVLVAEGWMHKEGLKAAGAQFRSGGYHHLYLTGTVRPFTYYLAAGDSIDVVFSTPRNGRLRIGSGGLPGAGLHVGVAEVPLLNIEAAKGIQDHSLELFNTTTITISAYAPNASKDGVPVMFVGRLLVNGENVHAEECRITVRRADGRVEPGTPTFAHRAMVFLQQEGLALDSMTAVPTFQVHESRTYSTARSFTAFADAHGIEQYDVATLAVHARRTWRMYRIARGDRPGAGIIALHDPWCQRWTWWTNYYGLFQVGKELIAWPAPWLIKDPDREEDPGAEATLGA